MPIIGWLAHKVVYSRNSGSVRFAAINCSGLSPDPNLFLIFWKFDQAIAVVNQVNHFISNFFTHFATVIQSIYMFINKAIILTDPGIRLRELS